MFVHLERMAANYRQQGQFRTGETYTATLNSFRRFRGEADVRLDDMDTAMIESYECWLRRNELSANTVSFYMKHLRSAYNRAVDEGQVEDSRPFRRVSTATGRTAKRALPLKVIRMLKSMDCDGSGPRCFARDMFMFSFYTRGMSFVDIAYLKKSNLKGGILSYRRRKTFRELAVRWEPCMEEILGTYRADVSSPYLFSIIRDPSGNERRQYLSAMSFINRHLKEIGRSMGLDRPLTMYCARHSWASIARGEGVPISVISEGMGHESERTTQIYLASLETDAIDSANRKILQLL